MPTDPYAKRLLWFVFMGSKGGLNRIRLISVIRKKPLNANQLAKEMGLDYKAIQHHIGVLEKNNLITRVGDKYGANFFISTFLEVNLDVFDEIVSKLEKSE
ncbi:MAG: winged helix-turn-helix transcriptional regulator [Thaumarchaeota archaeon]|nr:MAG: winged helix-turn-helix transcriptional regulator [Nitrososphaerota archaeon]